MATMTTQEERAGEDEAADDFERRRIRGPVPETADVVIVGAGLGGLVAGAGLARRGLRVAVFDAHSIPGGCATHFARGPRSARYHFDVGVHYLGDCAPDGAIPGILRNVGVSLDFEPLDQDGFDTFVFPDFEFRVPASTALYRERLVTLFPHERRGIDKYMRLLAQLTRAARRTEARGGRLRLRDVLFLARDLYGLGRNQNRTIGAVLDDYVKDPKLRAVLLGQNGDYGLPPSEVSAFLHLGLAAHYFRGAYYPRGGGQVIADSLARVIEQNGGSLHLRQPVDRIVLEKGRAVGVRLEPKAGAAARVVRAPVVLSNADYKATFEKLVGLENLPASWAVRLPKLQMADPLFMTYLGVRGDMRARGMRATNYWQFDDYDMERFYQDARKGTGFRSRGCYVTSATLKDPATRGHHAPEGISNLEVMTVAPGALDHWNVKSEDAVPFRYKDNGAYRSLKAQVEEELVGRLDKLFPGTREAIVFRESATPVTHQRYTRASGGTGYGLAATPSQFLQNRPGYRGPLEGLYLCGASMRAGHGSVGSMMSGEHSAGRILKDLGRAIT